MIRKTSILWTKNKENDLKARWYPANDLPVLGIPYHNSFCEDFTRNFFPPVHSYVSIHSRVKFVVDWHTAIIMSRYGKRSSRTEHFSTATVHLHRGNLQSFLIWNNKKRNLHVESTHDKSPFNWLIFLNCVLYHEVVVVIVQAQLCRYARFQMKWLDFLWMIRNSSFRSFKVKYPRNKLNYGLLLLIQRNRVGMTPIDLLYLGAAPYFARPAMVAKL